MASAFNSKTLVALMAPTAAAAGYGATRPAAKAWLTRFFVGPGKWSRLLVVLLCLLNWKSMPGMWTIRIWRAMIWHIFVRPRPRLPPKVLFHHAVTTSYTSLLETDYNLHKSNSTYFADLDVSRTHCVSSLMRPGLKALAENEVTRLVLDPRTGEPVRGRMGVMLGSVHASFRREIKPLESFQMWTRVLSWDRKWLYLVTHFVQPTPPTSWDWRGRNFGRTREPKPTSNGSSTVNAAGVNGAAADPGWEKRVFATCVSKYVFKLGRLTVNPAVVIDQSGLLPEGRPGGWTGGDSGTGTPVDLEQELGDHVVDLSATEWSWQQIEKLRLDGLYFAERFGDLDKLHATWDAGEDGALGHFAVG